MLRIVVLPILATGLLLTGLNWHTHARRDLSSAEDTFAYIIQKQLYLR